MRWMAKLATEAQLDPELRALAEKIVHSVFKHDYLSEYAAILNWIRRNIRYIRDPLTIEQVKTPRVIVETEAGDCDDLSTLAAAMVASIGGKVRFVAGTFARNGPLSHVWLEAYDPAAKVWVILDTVPGRKVAEMAQRLKNTISIPAVQ
jgi:transglutaminase-like putative cysteine protease